MNGKIVRDLFDVMRNNFTHFQWMPRKISCARARARVAVIGSSTISQLANDYNYTHVYECCECVGCWVHDIGNYFKVKPHSMPRTFFGIVHLRSTPFPSSQRNGVRLVIELCANQLNRFLCLCLSSSANVPVNWRRQSTQSELAKIEDARNTHGKIRGNCISKALRTKKKQAHKMNDLERTFFSLSQLDSHDWDAEYTEMWIAKKEKTQKKWLFSIYF